LLHSIVEHNFKSTPHVISSKICQFKVLNLRGGASLFEGADGSAVNDYNIEENEAVVEEHGSDRGSGIPEGNQQNAAQLEQMKEQSRSIPRLGLCI
jgi:hypothetical protein